VRKKCDFVTVGSIDKKSTHLDMANANSHIYYLSEYRDNERINTSHSPDARFEYDVSYLIFECDLLGFWCHRIYRSEDQGDPSDNDEPLGGRLEFDRTTNTLYLQEGNQVLFTHQVAP
jgi:hypothetical protein